MAQDVLGGQFAWASGPGGKPTIRYLAPDTLRWEDSELGYGRWLAAMIGGAMTEFYHTLRWQGWAQEVAACGLDQAISALPPPWTGEGKDLNAVSRRPMPMHEVVALMGVR